MFPQRQCLPGLLTEKTAVMEIDKIPADATAKEVFPQKQGETAREIRILLAAQILEAKEAAIQIDHDARREDQPLKNAFGTEGIFLLFFVCYLEKSLFLRLMFPTN